MVGKFVDDKPQTRFVRHHYPAGIVCAAPSFLNQPIYSRFFNFEVPGQLPKINLGVALAHFNFQKFWVGFMFPPIDFQISHQSCVSRTVKSLTFLPLLAFCHSRSAREAAVPLPVQDTRVSNRLGYGSLKITSIR